MKPTLLEKDELTTALHSLTGWELTGQAITKRYDFTTYMAGIDFVVEVAKEAEALNHHPELLVGWRNVVATLSTHSAGGLTDLDIKMARRMDTCRATLY